MRNKTYPTDLTDEQWKVIQLLLPKRRPCGRPPTERRRILDALFYLVRAGCAWRLLPKEFGPWETVYGCFRRWRQQGLWELIQHTLRSLVRREAGRGAKPFARPTMPGNGATTRAKKPRDASVIFWWTHWACCSGFA